MAELAVRTIFSLALVLGLLLLLIRFAGRRYRGNAGVIKVLHRQAISRGSAVSVVSVGQRLLVLGTTEQQVRVLTELAPEDLDGYLEETDVEQSPALAPVRALSSAPAPVRAPVTDRTPAPEEGPYAGFAAQLLAEVRGEPDSSSVRLADRPIPATSRHAPPTAGRHAARHRSVPARPETRPAAARAGGVTGPLSGSLLSPQTWRQTWQAVTRRAS